MNLNRVVVTGLGSLTPIGNNTTEYWDNLIHGKSGAGLIANFAMFLNLIIVMAVLAMLNWMPGDMNVTLTFPGIAGLILTIGMAVDANVIIFERIQEELAVGKTPSE